MKIKATDQFNLEKAIKELEQTVAQVGFFENAKYDDGTPIAEVARDNEFGVPAKRIPSRPFFRNAIEKGEKEWSGLYGKMAEQVLGGKTTAAAGVEKIAMLIKGDVQQSIIDGSYKKISIKTIKGRLAKGNTSIKPLEDTKTLLHSVAYNVEVKK